MNQKVHYRVHNSQSLGPTQSTWIQSTTSQPIFLRCNVTLRSLSSTPSFHKVRSLSDLQPKILYAFLFSTVYVTSPAHLILLVLITLGISGENYILWSFPLWIFSNPFSLPSRYIQIYQFSDTPRFKTQTIYVFSLNVRDNISNPYKFTILTSRDTSAGMAKGYWLDSQGLIPGKGKRFFSTPQHPDRL
jgi:hypothetical protein